MNTEIDKDWILCRSYRFPNKFYYFNIHNGESKWAYPEKQFIQNLDKSKDNNETSKINLNNLVEPNIETEDGNSLVSRRSFDNKLELNCNKSQKLNDKESQIFLTNNNTHLLLHSHTPTSMNGSKQKFQMKNEKKKTVQNHKSFHESGYNRQRKIIRDPLIKFHSSQDSQSEDLSKEALSSLTNKMEHINLLGYSANELAGECDNFIAQHNQKWFIFRKESENGELIKFHPFGRKSVWNIIEKPIKKNMAKLKHETNNTCFIVIDLNVLLNDFEFINDKVLQDSRYRLVIPNIVKSKLRNLAEMDHKSHQIMVTAQELIWKIPTQSRHIIFEPEEPITTPQQIINCCKKITNLNYSLILLTSDADLYASAIGHKFVCYMIQDVKESLCDQLFTTPYNQHEDDINNNLFLQKPEEIEPFNFSNSMSDVNGNYSFYGNFDGETSLKETVYEKLKKYSLKNYHMASLIVLRAEDFLCTFTQIMETFSSELLLSENVSCDFCTIPQAVDKVAQLYSDSTSIQIVAYRMSALYNLINKNNKLETKYKADILIKMVGCGMILVESIKYFKPNSEILSETENLLIELLQSIENPNRFDNDMEQSKIVRKYDSRDNSETSCEDYDIRSTNNIDYHNGHFTDLNDNEEISKQTNFINNRIIRTTGRNLNSLIISSTNAVTLDTDENYNTIHYNNDDKNKIDLKISLNEYNEEISKRVFDSTLHENAFTSLENAPKIIRNFGAIKTMEEKLEKKSLDTIDNIVAKCERNIKESNTNVNKYSRIDLDKISETYTDVAYHTEVNNSESVNDKCTENLTLSASNDSGLGKDCCNVHLLIKKFILDMNSTLNIVYKFIIYSSLVLKGKNIKSEKRREIFDKAYKTYHRMSLVVDNLRNVIKREKEADTTVGTLLERAGVDVTKDKLINNYKQIVATYLEQVDLLQQALKIIYIATNTN